MADVTAQVADVTVQVIDEIVRVDELRLHQGDLGHGRS